MSGFNNAVVGGVSKLIRTAIQSPNYAPGSAGWTINKDGSAEFNNASFRGTVIIESTGEAVLVYNGTPAAGNLVLAIAKVAGVDSVGNHYGTGLTISDAVSNNGLNFIRNNGQALAAIAPSASGGLYVNTNNTLTLGYGFTAGTGLQIGAGPIGKYYYEEVLVQNGQSVPASTTTKLVNLTAKQDPPGTPVLFSDYSGSGSAWDLVNGIWTAPDSSIYHWTIDVGYQAWPSANVGSAVMAIRNNLTNSDSFLQIESESNASAAAPGRVTIAGDCYFKKGDTARVYVIQRQTTAQLLSQSNDMGRIAVRRVL